MRRIVSGTAPLLIIILAGLGTGCAGAPEAVAPDDGRIRITVTEKGFEPAVVTVPAGRPVTLLVTRKTDRTCARDFVMADEGIREPLPLDRPVEITFTPETAGELRYACAMDMIVGTIRAE